MKRVTVYYGQNKITFEDKLYHRVSHNDWNRLKTMCERKRSRESMIPTRPAVSGDDVKLCAVQIPEFQFSQREISKPGSVNKYDIKHCTSTKLNISKGIDVGNGGEVSEKIKGITEEKNDIPVKYVDVLERQGKIGKARCVYYKQIKTLQELLKKFEEEISH